MAALHLARSGFSPALRIRPLAPLLFPLRLSAPPGPAPLRCRLSANNGGGPDGWEEPPESLFMKELKRRGMTPTSLLEDSDRVALGWDEREMEAKEESGGRGERTNRNGLASAAFETGMMRQKERSMSLNSEGFEGLLPRAKLLLTIGGTFFFGFWPLILVTTGLFAALYMYFGSSFVHDASEMPVSPPPYIDPHSLLEDERLPHVAQHIN